MTSDESSTSSCGSSALLVCPPSALALCPRSLPSLSSRLDSHQGWPRLQALGRHRGAVAVSQQTSRVKGSVSTQRDGLGVTRIGSSRQRSHGPPPALSTQPPWLFSHLPASTSPDFKQSRRHAPFNPLLPPSALLYRVPLYLCLTHLIIPPPLNRLAAHLAEESKTPEQSQRLAHPITFFFSLDSSSALLCFFVPRRRRRTSNDPSSRPHTLLPTSYLRLIASSAPTATQPFSHRSNSPRHRTSHTHIPSLPTCTDSSRLDSN
ncbi:hypothetical protein CDD81_2041 [Ophiocordyceps australis]|uniref:Uncharacterized protein n=1 Tax=Ophiocordyceps australis TaxID=1399860 RepID=A0A2C5YD23_9HYPO|nr:hypothetical protein CDD81_2041 [Ophiocordyceps australis]